MHFDTRADAFITADMFRQFIKDILHGSEEHRQWLKEAGEAFLYNRPMPEMKD